MDSDDIESQDVGGEDSDSVEMEDLCHPLVDSIRGMFETIRPTLTLECCIYRVPNRLLKLNEAIYTPQVLSIGPFHRGKENFQTMEKHKVRYLKDFLGRTKKSLEDFIVYTKELEESTRNCYAETIELSSDEFVKMILLDGVFIIELLLKTCVDEVDDVLHMKLLDSEIYYDLILLENQIPFFVIEGLYNLAFKFEDQPSFLELASTYFSNNNNQEVFPKVEVKHFTDLLRMFQLPLSPSFQPRDKRKKVKMLKSVSAAELHKAGMKFKTGSSKCLFDIKFTDGVLEIPCFTIEEDTESFFKNLMALEQCHYRNNSYICDYFFLMGCLINTEKDVDLLVQNGIIINRLGDNEAVATQINKQCIQIRVNGDNFYFAQLLDELNAYYKSPWHNWKATLKRDYFSTPWRSASTIAAVILFVLTLIQTVCSIISILSK